MDFWISSIKITSIVAAGLFGTLGLLTKYKEGDKITRWGKTALIGIILSALMSLALQMLQTSKESNKQREDAIRSAAEARKAEVAAKETSKRLEDILLTAKDTSDQQSKNLAQAEILTGKMDKSLTAQRDVLSGNQRILTGVVEGAHRDTKNTIGILRTIWDESNRIDASQITVHIDYEFLRQTVTRPPLLFAGEESLSLVVAPSDPRVAVPSNPWSERHLLAWDMTPLQARQQKVAQTKKVTVDSTQYEQSSYFSDFRGDLDRFSGMSNWNGAWVEVVLKKEDPSLLKDLERALEWNSRGKKDWEYFNNYYPQAHSLRDDYSVTPLPIAATLRIYVRGRQVARSSAVLVKVTGHDEDVSGLIVAKFRIVTIIDKVFPEFKPTL